MVTHLWLIPVGFLIGAIGTIVGAGGGFMLMPLLLLVYPDESPELLTAISLATIFFNAASGSISYARMKRIDYRAGVWFAIAAVPGAIGGAILTEYIPRQLFDRIFGVFLLLAAGYLLQKSKTIHRRENPLPGEGLATGPDPRHSTRRLAWGAALSFFVGALSSLLGIGGGIVHVPVMITLLGFPVHVATATSHFVLAIMALAGTGVHVAHGIFSHSHGVWRTVDLALGVVVGAQVGARLSTRISGRWIIVGLAAALALVAGRILFKAL